MVSKTLEFACRQDFCNNALERKKDEYFSKLSEVSSRILGVVSKATEFAQKQGYCNIVLEIEKASCFLNYLK